MSSHVKIGGGYVHARGIPIPPETLLQSTDPRIIAPWLPGLFAQGSTQQVAYSKTASRFSSTNFGRQQRHLSSQQKERSHAHFGQTTQASCLPCVRGTVQIELQTRGLQNSSKHFRRHVPSGWNPADKFTREMHGCCNSCPTVLRNGRGFCT